MQKLVRAGFGVNNVDTCARVCHSPTGYGLKTTFGTSAGTQDFDSVEHADVILVIGANPTDGHPVFASRMKKRLREGAKLIVVDPRRIDLVRTPHVEAAHHLPLHARHQRGGDHRHGARDRHRGARQRGVRARALRPGASSRSGPRSSPRSAIRPRPWPSSPASTRPRCAPPRASTPPAATRPSTTASASPSTARARRRSWRIANLAMATGNLGRPGVGVNPLRGQNNVQGSCDMGSFPHELSRLPPRLATMPPAPCSRRCGARTINPEPGLRIPNMLDAARRWLVQGPLHPGRGHPAVRPQHHPRVGRPRRHGVRGGAGPVPERDRELRPRVPAGLHLPGEGRHLHQRRAPHPARAPRHEPAATATPTGRSPSSSPRPSASTGITPTPARSWTRSRSSRPPSPGVSYAKLEELGSVQWPCNAANPVGSPVMHVTAFTRGKGKFMLTEYVPTDERTGPRYPAAAHHRAHPVAVQRRRPDAAHRQRGVARRGPAGDPPARRRAARRQGRRLGAHRRAAPARPRCAR